MKILKLLPAIMVLLSVLACTPSPKPIDYGSDMCHYCKMTIVDKQHAAEAVTDKGKVFKFDAIECMVDYLQKEEEKYTFLLVADYEKPGKLLPAESSNYLISEAIPSPMGAYLSAFENEGKAKDMQAKKGGSTYSWEELKSYLKK